MHTSKRTDRLWNLNIKWAYWHNIPWFKQDWLILQGRVPTTPHPPNNQWQPLPPPLWSQASFIDTHGLTVTLHKARFIYSSQTLKHISVWCFVFPQCYVNYYSFVMFLFTETNLIMSDQLEMNWFLPIGNKMYDFWSVFLSTVFIKKKCSYYYL